jgi:hydroxyquinol 1,2-dioxygenase
VQRPNLEHHQARAVLRTDADGYLRFRTVLPVAYPVPTDGPVGKMLVATGRHPWRPAHIHFMVVATGFERLITHVFRGGDPYMDSDVVFGVRSSLIGQFEKHPAGTAPDGSSLSEPFHTLNFDFVLQPV